MDLFLLTWLFGMLWGLTCNIRISLDYGNSWNYFDVKIDNITCVWNNDIWISSTSVDSEILTAKLSCNYDDLWMVLADHSRDAHRKRIKCIYFCRLETLKRPVSQTANKCFFVIWDPINISGWVACFHHKIHTRLQFAPGHVVRMVWNSHNAAM